jgi:branched-subunit amino acid ABC-type transport system permease component
MESVIRGIFLTASSTSVLVLLVLGMAVIVGMMRVINMAQGEFVLLGAVTAFVVHGLTGSTLLGMLAAPVVVGLIGAVLERTLIRRFYGNPAGALLLTFAIGFFIREVVRSQMQTQATTVPAPLPGYLTVGGANLEIWRLVIIVVTVVVVAGSWLALTRTSIGLKVRATLDNPELAAASGISINAMYTGTFAFGSALAGLAGGLIVPIQTLYPDLGLNSLTPMFISVFIGGLGSLFGPLLGGVLIGVPQYGLSLVISVVLAQAVVLAAAIVFMRLRPLGLFGK